MQAWTTEHPDRFKLASIGKSFEGRDIWLATLTNFGTGPDTDKPAFFVEANIHAAEVTGCTAALHLINKLLTHYGVDEKVTRVMDTRAFYIVPRLNPDGAELALADRPKFIRSSVRDPNGAWKPYPGDPRLLVPREPDEAPGGAPNGGEFYRLLTEGATCAGRHRSARS